VTFVVGDEFLDFCE